MSKNFEETYKAEVQRNIPDLWDRIESSLPEKNVTEVKAPAKKKTETKKVATPKKTTTRGRKTATKKTEE